MTFRPRKPTDQELEEIAIRESKDAKIKAWIVIPAWIISTTAVALTGATFVLAANWRQFDWASMIIGTLVTAGGTFLTFKLPIWIKAINPQVQADQAKALKQLQDGELVLLSDEEIIKTANILKLFLQ